MCLLQLRAIQPLSPLRLDPVESPEIEEKVWNHVILAKTTCRWPLAAAPRAHPQGRDVVELLAPALRGWAISKENWAEMQEEIEV